MTKDLSKKAEDNFLWAEPEKRREYLRLKLLFINKATAEGICKGEANMKRLTHNEVDEVVVTYFGKKYRIHLSEKAYDKLMFDKGKLEKVLSEFAEEVGKIIRQHPDLHLDNDEVWMDCKFQVLLCLDEILAQIEVLKNKFGVSEI